MDHSHTGEVDSHQLAEAEAFWNHFVLAAKVGIVAIALLLGAMAIGFYVL